MATETGSSEAARTVHGYVLQHHRDLAPREYKGADIAKPERRKLRQQPLVLPHQALCCKNGVQAHNFPPQGLVPGRILANPSPPLLRWLAGLAERMTASRPASGLQLEEPEESTACWDPAMLAGVDASSHQIWIRVARSRRCGSGRRLPVGDGNERCGLFV
jgi:hypothetical protein